MHRKLIPVVTGFTTILFLGNAIAQQDAPMPTPVVEIFGCTFEANNDMADLTAVTARWSAWADRNDVRAYTAFIATPYLRSPDLPYDALWIGAWPNGAAMAAEEARYLAEGGEIEAAFDAILDCPAHAQYAEVVINAPQGPPPQNGIAVFRDCTVRDGRTVPEAITALQEWSKYLATKGSSPFSAMLFGLAGLENDADYTFKSVEGFESMAAYGQYTDAYTGGGFLRADELFGRLLDCNSARVYALNRIRAAAQPQ
jgi:hypothetical protein